MALLLPCCGGLTLIGALSDGNEPRAQPAAERAAEQVVGEPTESAPAERAPAESATTAPSETEPAETEPAETEPSPTEAAVTKETVTVRQPIPFSTRTVKDSSLAKGETKVRTRGVNGVRTLSYEVTATGRKLIRTVITRKPVTKVVAVGTRTAPSGGDCHDSYQPCVPIASDVDCAGGSGNGPAYVDGPIRVIGPDDYDLDRDGDGVACD